MSEILESLRDRGLWRELRTVGSPPGPEMVVAGRRVLQFASNDYLALAADPRLADAACAAARAGGAGGAASRLIIGSHGYVTQLEQRLAEFKKTEAALVLPTGYMANLALVTSLVGPGDAVFADRLCHASILDGIILSRARLVRFAHNDPRALDEALRQKSRFRRRLVVTESVFSMDGDVAPLKELAAVAAAHGAMFVVDEAHATGVFGATGAGVAEEQGIGHLASAPGGAAVAAPGGITATVGTLSKALGGLGGFIAGARAVIEMVVNRGRAFIYSTAIPPGQAAAALAALEVVRDEPERRTRLLDAAAKLRQRLTALGCDIGSSASQIVPVIVGDAERASAASRALWERGIFVPAIRPPSVPRGRSRLRISLTSGHSDEHVARLLSALAEIRPLSSVLT